MEMELRSDGLHFSGYVNVTGKLSKPIITLERRRMLETIEERAFQEAINKKENVQVWLDHRSDRVIAQTKDGNLELREDSIGLHAAGIITDKEIIDNADKLSGWSFGMKSVKADIEERGEQLPIRRIKSMELDHVALLLHKRPAYSATSIELREDNAEDELELRTDEEIIVKNMVETPEKTCNLTLYKNRMNKLKAGK